MVAKGAAAIPHDIRSIRVTEVRPTAQSRDHSIRDGSPPDDATQALNAAYRRFAATRAQSERLIEGLEPEDMVVQSMEDASPVKWHLAHTTWFFESFLLRPHAPGYREFDPRYAYLFNSYYVQAGPRYARPQRGLVTRPTVAETRAFRAHVDAGVAALVQHAPTEKAGMIAEILELGRHHEMQHQELLATDLLHALSFNPLEPAYRRPEPLGMAQPALPARFVEYEGGVVEIGAGPETPFSYDCEGPRHQTLIQPFRLASRPVTNGEWIAFVEDGGYETPTLWLSDGWARAQAEGWTAPLYWRRETGDGGGRAWWAFGLRGAQPVDADAPVVHVSYYEADAFARWAGKRLPSEFEWEHAARRAHGDDIPAGNFMESGHFRPRPTGSSDDDAPGALYGDVWEWTRSPFTPYPGYRPVEGALGEYNGKFMVNQFVLRGGSCATPRDQMRASYRNFFHPHQRWQMMGLRLAEDAK